MIHYSPTKRDDGHGFAPAALDVYFLGCVDFAAAEFLQQTFVDELEFRRDGHGKLLICEHPPIISIGREGGHENLSYADAWLKENHEDQIVRPPLDVRWVKRGGGAIVHAPGQLAIYPVVPYAQLGWNAVEYRNKLQQAVTRACEEVRIGIERREGRNGLFTRNGQIGFVGITCRNGIANYGVYLNVAAPLELLQQARWSTADATAGPDERVDPANMVQSRRVTLSSIRERLMYHIQRELGFERSHLYTSHPLLHRVRRTTYEYA